MQAYSRRVPSGERLPGVLWPWAGSRRMSMGIWISCLSDSQCKDIDYIFFDEISLTLDL